MRCAPLGETRLDGWSRVSPSDWAIPALESPVIFNDEVKPL